LVFRCLACGRGWEDALAFFPVPDETIAKRAWLCLGCAAPRSGAVETT
jgi:hypothetical protein